jgi:hypothetical protein
MKKVLTIALLIAAFGVLFIGCGKDNEIDDQTAIGELIGTSGMFGQDMNYAEPVQMASSRSPIWPLFFWRSIVAGTRTRSVDVSGSTAEVTVQIPFTGLFNIITGTDTLPDTLQKTEADNAVISVSLERTGAITDPHRGWEITGVSGIDWTSSPSTTKNIVSVTIISSSGLINETFSDITVKRAPDDLPTVGLGDTVTITVITGDSTDLVFLHAHNSRSRFTSNGDGSFTGTWVTDTSSANYGGYRHCAFDVISHPTLFDNTAAYDAKAWGFLYKFVDAPVLE